MTLPSPRNAVEITLVSDGEKTVYAKNLPSVPSSPLLRSTFTQALCGLGIFHSSTAIVAEGKASKTPLGLLGRDEIFDWRMIERIKNTATLVYKVRKSGRSTVNKFELGPQTIEVKLS